MKIILSLLATFTFLFAFSQQKIWRANVTTGEYGLLTTNFILQQKDNYLIGNSKPDAHKRIIGGLKGSMAKNMFQNNGSLIEIDSLLITENKVSGYLILERKKYFIQGIKTGNKITGDLLGKASKKIYGKIEAEEVSTLEKPKDYKKVWNEVKGLTEKFIFNKTYLDTKEWAAFVKYMDEFSEKAEDDAEFIYGFYYKAPNLPFSHYIMTGHKDTLTNYAIAGQQENGNKGKPTLAKINTDTYLLDVPAFNFRVNDIDSLMEEIVKGEANNLIIDLRNNPGGDMEGAMRISEYLADKPIFTGVLLAQSHWNKNNKAPDVADYSKFKLMNKANYEWFKNEVKNGVEGLSLVTYPLAKTVKGKVFVLTSNVTASASEPFVYALQKEKIATIIGSKTAGAMVSMLYFYVDNFDITIPILDYYTSDGKRLDKIGVSPDIACDPKDALNIALEKIKNSK